MNKENLVKNIKIIKSMYIDENLLKEFYSYIHKNKIKEVENVEDANLIISFGGDGTTLVAAKETIKNNVPILAVNMGTLGYLAEIKLENVIEIFEKYKNNECIIDERNFLEVHHNNNVYYALNELVIVKGGLISHLINVDVYANDIFVNKYRADGVIVATPTGSTAYSLSAGGSIVHPGLKAVTITPLSPQSLTTRPIIIDGQEKLTFKATSRDNDIHLNIDGRTCIHVNENDIIKAHLSEKKVKIIRTKESNYYDILRKKLQWGNSIIK